jgi:F-type H+-transporting ATPase subunit gamma
MAKARSILKRTKAVKSTRTITKTMEMISTARFKKTHDRVAAAKPYTQAIGAMVADLVASVGGDVNHPLLHADELVKPYVLMVITANRGLCGSYNSAVLRLAMERLEHLQANGKDVQLYVVGKKGISFLKFRKFSLARSFSDFDYQVDYRKVSDLADDLMDQFISKQIGGVEVVHTQFISSGKQKAGIAHVLPLSVEPSQAKVKGDAKTTQPLFEYLPSSAVVLEKLLPASIRIKLYQCFLDASVSEQIARMTSMRAATDNADDMIHSLTVRYNRMRQSQITTELSEIMGGRAGMEDG